MFYAGLGVRTLDSSLICQFLLTNYPIIDYKSFFKMLKLIEKNLKLKNNNNLKVQFNKMKLWTYEIIEKKFHIFLPFLSFLLKNHFVEIIELLIIDL